MVMPMTPEGQVAEGHQSGWAMEDFQDPPRNDGGVALCGACRDSQTCRLGVTREGLDGADTAAFALSFPPDPESGPQVAHGGWTGAGLYHSSGPLPPLPRVWSRT